MFTSRNVLYSRGSRSPAARLCPVLALLTLLLSGGAGASTAPGYTVSNLGSLGPTAAGYSPVGFNDAGQYAANDTVPVTGVSRAVLYSGGLLVDLGTLGGTASTATAINAGGQVIGMSATNNGSVHGFLYSNGLMTDLGVLGTNSSGSGSSSAIAINAGGQVTGASDVYDAQHVPHGRHAFLYSNGQMTDLGALGGTDSSGHSYSSATAISAGGQVVGYSTVYDAQHNYLGSHAFLYSNGQMTDLGGLGTDSTGHTSSSACAINASGQVAGTSDVYDAQHAPHGRHAFLFSNGQMTDLGGLGTDGNGGSTSSATALNDSGQVTGYSYVYDAQHNYHGPQAFLYSNGQMTGLGTLSGTDSSGRGNSSPCAINAGGQVVGYSSVYDAQHVPQGKHAFLYSSGQMTDLGALGTDSGGSSTSSACAINTGGQIIGTSAVYDAQHNPQGQHGFLYGNGQMTDLGTVGVPYSSATAVNAAGQVIGTSATSTGSVHGFLGSNGQMTDLGVLGGTDSTGHSSSSAAALNAGGQVAGTSDAYDAQHTYHGAHAFLYSGGQMTDLGGLGMDSSGSSTSSACAINAGGQVTGVSNVYDAQHTYHGAHAFLYSSGQMTDLGGSERTAAATVPVRPGDQRRRPGRRHVRRL